MPAPRPRPRLRGWAPARRWSPTALDTSAPCRATRPSAVSARAIWSARSTPSTASWAGVADRAGIQFRLLNRRKGPAVRGPRTQADRKLYAPRHAGASWPSTPNLTWSRARPTISSCEDGRVAGLVLAGRARFSTAGAVVLTTGTFLRGLIHIGETQDPGGPDGRGARRLGLSQTLERLGFPLGRLKTGTPPRLDGRTIDWAGVDKQAGDDEPVPFSALTDAHRRPPQIECGITRTTAAGHDLIRANLHRAPMYSGDIQSRGPRYCPSIEDKVVRFGDRDGHQIFLEPEGLDDLDRLPERHLDLPAGGRAARSF